MVSRVVKPVAEKRRRKKNIPLRIILLALIVALGYFGVTKLLIHEEVEVMLEFSLDGKNIEESKEIFKNPNIDEGEYEFKDYVIYGESLNLYASTYEMGTKDEMHGKSVMCRNMSTGSEHVFYLGEYLDQGIPMYELPEGVYEVFVSSLLDNKRLFKDEAMEEVFYTVTRKGINHRVHIITSQNYFYPHDEAMKLDKNYMYIWVEKMALPEDQYDVIIDPGHFAYDCYSNKCYGYIDNGYALKNNEMIEAEEDYKVALVLKEELESYGLKVLLTCK